MPPPRGLNFGLGSASRLRRQSHSRGQTFDLEAETRPKVWYEDRGHKVEANVLAKAKATS